MDKLKMAIKIARTAYFKKISTLKQLYMIAQQILSQTDIQDVEEFVNSNITILITAEDFNQLINNGDLLIIFQQSKDKYANYIINYLLDKYEIIDMKNFNEAFRQSILSLKLNIQFVITKTPYVILNVTKEEFNKFIDNILQQKQIIDLIKKEVLDTPSEKIEIVKNTNRLINDISSIKLKKEESIQIDGRLIHHISHDNNWRAFVYINGNILINRNYRIGHGELFKLYFNNLEENHANDIIPFQKCTASFANIRKYHGVRGVIKDNVALLIDAEGLVAEAARIVNQQLGCTVLAFINSFNTLIRKAQIMSSEEYAQGEVYVPTEQDILDTQQIPFEELIKPVEQEVKAQLYKDVKRLVSSYARHYIHKNKDKTNDELYSFVMSKINFSSIFWDLIYYSYPLSEYFRPIKSEKQLHYDFVNYMKKHFALYIRLLIDKYKNELVLNYKQQSKDKNYHTDPYIRTPEQLDLLIDDVHDLIQLDASFTINYKCRDSAFIFVKGEAYTGDSHINLMRKYLRKNNISDPYYFNLENINKLQLPYAYGHIYHGRALINWYKYCTRDEVKNALLKKGKYFIYDYNTNEQTLYRLAQKI